VTNPSDPAGVSRIVLGGGIGAGKSRVAEFLADHGFVVISADLLGHDVLEPDGAAFAEVAGRWPAVVRDGRIDRSALAAIVFVEPSELAELERMTHPHIVDAIRERAANVNGPLVLEVPVMLPLDGDWLRVFVDADEEARIDRAVSRGGHPGDVRLRAAAQADRAAWLAWADEVIVNDGSEEELRRAVEALMERLGVGR
jgi:dephospho-CoA kinase